MNPTELKEQFASNGFAINGAELLPQDLIRRASQGMDAIRRGEYDTGIAPGYGWWKPELGDKVLCKIENPQHANRAVRELIAHPTIGKWASAARGAKKVQVWWVQLLYKPPTPPNAKLLTNVGWHQDRNYWQCWTPGSELFTCWVALSDVTPESGPMHFVRGSHHWGYREGSDFRGQDLEAIKKNAKVPADATWEEVPAILPAGGFTLHHDLTWHGSGPNHSAIPRRSFAIHLRTENSAPVNNNRDDLTQFIDDPTRCPWIYP